MQADVVSRRLDPFHRLHRYEDETVAAPHHEPLEGLRRAGYQRRYPLVGLIRLPPNPFGRALPSLAEAIRIDRFQKVVDRVRLEGPHRVAIKRRDEDDGGHRVGTDALQHLKPADGAQLDIEEQHVWR